MEKHWLQNYLSTSDIHEILERASPSLFSLCCQQTCNWLSPSAMSFFHDAWSDILTLKPHSSMKIHVNMTTMKINNDNSENGWWMKAKEEDEEWRWQLRVPWESSLLRRCQRVLQHKNDRVSSQEHFGDEAIFVDRFGLLLAFSSFWNLCPHHLHILQHHVAMSGRNRIKINY